MTERNFTRSMGKKQVSLADNDEELKKLIGEEYEKEK